MVSTVSRASLLRGGFRGEIPVNRPPWALDEAPFTAVCNGCLRCRDGCPEKIIVAGRGGFPEVKFAAGGCTFCGDCVRACPSGALVNHGQAPWRHKARIGSQCFSRQGVICRLCQDQCETRAISFRPALGGLASPEVDAAACTGCGLCVGVCPAEAIEMGQVPS